MGVCWRRLCDETVGGWARVRLDIEWRLDNRHCGHQSSLWHQGPFNGVTIALLQYLNRNYKIFEAFRWPPPDREAPCESQGAWAHLGAVSVTQPHCIRPDIEKLAWLVALPLPRAFTLTLKVFRLDPLCDELLFPVQWRMNHENYFLRPSICGRGISNVITGGLFFLIDGCCYPKLVMRKIKSIE